MLKYLQYFCRATLILLAIFWATFSLLSGADSQNNGLKGILLNSPNMLPWLLILVIIYITWKWEFIGGLLTTASGLFFSFFFQSAKSPIIFWTISFPLIILGLLLITHWYFFKKDI